MPGARDSVETEQVSLFLGENWVLTFQERGGDCFDPVRTRIREGKGRIRRLGADYLAYALIDAVVDEYFPLLEGTADRLDALEEEVLAAPDRSTLARIQRVKSELRSLQKAARPHRDLLSVMLHADAPFVREPTQVYLRDSLDHAVQLSEMIESYRETATDIMGVHLSSMSNRMNEVMKVLTIIASIFIPLSFVAGLYGMNFNPDASPWNMPELNWAWGYPAALGAMGLVALVMLLVFHWRGWFR
jgi:magnesium transporter